MGGFQHICQEKMLNRWKDIQRNRGKWHRWETGQFLAFSGLKNHGQGESAPIATKSSSLSRRGRLITGQKYAQLPCHELKHRVKDLQHP